MSIKRTCKKCKEEKELTIGFGRCGKNKKTGKIWYNGKCKTCCNKENKIWRDTNQSNVKKNNKKNVSRLSHRFHTSKRNAKKRGYNYEITNEDYDKLTTNQDCIYCRRHFEYVGVDRVCNDIGYKIGNVVPCCGTCNVMKGTMTYTQFINLCSIIANNHNHKY